MRPEVSDFGHPRPEGRGTFYPRSLKETADVPKWFGRDLYEGLDADTLALAAAYGWDDPRVRARLHDAVRAAAKEN